MNATCCRCTSLQLSGLCTAQIRQREKNLLNHSHALSLPDKRQKARPEKPGSNWNPRTCNLSLYTRLARLPTLDAREVCSGMEGTNPEGLYIRPKLHHELWSQPNTPCAKSSLAWSLPPYNKKVQRVNLSQESDQHTNLYLQTKAADKKQPLHPNTNRDRKVSKHWIAFCLERHKTSSTKGFIDQRNLNRRQVEQQGTGSSVSKRTAAR